MHQETITKRNESPVGATVSAAVLDATKATGLPLQRRGASGFTLQKQRERASAPRRAVALCEGGFTLAELLVSVGVLALLVFLGAQLLNSAATVTSLDQKQMDADSEARQLLDRMAVDFAQMVKRFDVDYYVKSSGTGQLRKVLQLGNDQ